MNEIELAILDLIEKRYKKKYIGGLSVTRLKNGYKLALSLGNSDIHPIVIAAEINDAKDFLKFVEQELISRQLIKVQYFTGFKYEPEDVERNSCKEN